MRKKSEWGFLQRSFRTLAGKGVPVFLFLFLVLFLGCGKEKKAPPPPPPTVDIVDVIRKEVPLYYDWIGTADGLVNATIRAQVTGYLTKQNYKEGDDVKKGQTLFEIDPRPFQAAMEQAKAELAQKEARYITAKANLTRIRPLAEKNAVSQKDLDHAVGSEQSSQADVLAAKAAVEKAQLDLGFTKITSPIDGIAGIAKAQLGNLVGPGQTEELTTVSTVDPIKVYISISEQEYMAAQQMKMKRVEKVPLELILSDGNTYPHKGEFTFADRQVDVRTGTIRVAALFANPHNLLRPGQFARVRAKLAVRKDALVVPQRAVTELQGKYLVAIVGPGNKVAIRPVKAEQQYERLWVITEGLQAGEKVVAEGIQKVRDGMMVTPKAFFGETQAQPEAARTVEASPEKR